MKKAVPLLICAGVVAALYESSVGLVIIASVVAVTAFAAVIAVYRNRLKPLPEIKKEEPKLPPKAQGGLIIQKQEMSTIQKEITFLSTQFKERALENGYEATSDVPQQLKI